MLGGGNITNSINRSIYFYQIDWIEEDNANPVVKNLNFFENILQNKSDILLEYNDEADLLIQKYRDPIENVPDNIGLWKLSKIRKAGFPRKVNFNTLIDADLNLQEYEGLYEPSHFAVFGGKFLLTEFNSYGARVQSTIRSKINDYLKENREILNGENNGQGNQELRDIKKIQIKPILEDDVIQRIDEFSEIREVTLKVATDYAIRYTESGNRSLARMFSSAQFVGDMYLNLGFTLGRKKPSNSLSLFSDIINNIKQLYRKNDLTAENFEKVSIRGKIDENKAPETLNLIEMLMKHERRVLKLDDTTRAVNPTNMYRELLDLYNLYKHDLENRYTNEE